MRKNIIKLYKGLQIRHAKQNEQITKIEIVIVCEPDSRIEDDFSVQIATKITLSDGNEKLYKVGGIGPSETMQDYLKECLDNLKR